MGQALEVVEQYYEAFDKKKPGWRQLVTDDVSFVGPVQRASGAAEFSALTEQFLQFHKGTRVFRRFEDGNDVCSIYEFTFSTPSGGAMSCAVVEWARVADGRIAEFNLFYDPREFMKAFGME